MAALNGTAIQLEDAGGYVLVGVIAFAAAVVMTVPCLRHRKAKENQQGNRDAQNEETIEFT